MPVPLLPILGVAALPILGAAGVGIVMALAVFIPLARGGGKRRVAQRRLEGSDEVITETITVAPIDVYPPRYRIVPWIIGLIVILVGVFGQLDMLFTVIFGLITIMLGLQIESALAERRVMKVEGQLAETIDLTVSALNSGASIINALTYAAGEVRAPFRDFLGEALDRIRLGDQPHTVFQAIADRIPLDNVRLFITSVTVNWETGGAIGPTLAMVGQAIRDRIEVSRRIRAMTAASRVAIIVVLAVTYFIAFVMWQADSERALAFAKTPVGGWMIAIAMLLQAVGIVWSNAITKPRF